MAVESGAGCFRYIFGLGIAAHCNQPNIVALGQLLYSRFLLPFELAGLILLVAMIGAIVLTLRHKPNVKRQSIAEQNARTVATAIEVRKVEPGRGI